MSSRLTFAKCKHIRLYSTKQKMQLVEDVNELLVNKDLKHRHHPGVSTPKVVDQPSWLCNSIEMFVKDKRIPLKQIQLHAQTLSSYLHERQLPKEADDIKLKLQEIKSSMQKNNIDSIESTTDDNLLKNNNNLNKFKSFIHSWKPMDYDMFACAAYLVGRSMPEYSALYKIFNEINTHDQNFAPRTLFDYGSGVGTVMWAASNFWNKSIKEYFCVDTSRDMNECSEYLIKNAVPKININHIFYRQFFPASPIPSYDLVVSAYSLMELPNQKSRLEVISKLWNKTEKYLVIVEQGTKYGFKVINEARDFLLNFTKKNALSKHVFSPCPHDSKCPVYMQNESIPCSFEIKYLTLPIAQKSAYKREIYSYVILKKDERPEDDVQWPRIIRPVMKRSKHVICRLCTASGEFQEQIFTTWKNGKNTYRCARSSELGDRLPFKLEEAKESEETEESEETKEQTE